MSRFFLDLIQINKKFKNKFFLDIFIYNYPIFFSILFSIISLPIITKNISISDYGLYELFILSADLLYFIFFFEFEQSIAIFSSETEDNKIKKRYFSSSINFILLSNLIFFIVGCYISYLNKDFQINFFLILFLFYFFLSLSKFIKNQLRWIFKSKFYSLIQILTSILIFFLIILFYFLDQLSLINLIIIHTLSHGIGFVIGFFVIVKNGLFSFFIDINIIKKFFKFSIPLIISSVMNYFGTFIDRYLINFFLNQDLLGNYSLAYKLGSISSIIFLGFALTLSPIIYNNSSKIKILSHLLKILTLVSFILLLFLWVIFSLFGEYIIYFFSNSQYSYSYLILILIFPSICLTNLWCLFPSLMINKNTKLILIINTLVILINILCSLVLINFFGVYGVALGTLIGSLFSTFIYFRYNTNYFNIKFNFKYLTLYIGFSLIIIIFNYFYSYIYFKIFFMLLLIYIFLKFISSIKFLERIYLLINKLKTN